MIILQVCRKQFDFIIRYKAVIISFNFDPGLNQQIQENVSVYRLYKSLSAFASKYHKMLRKYQYVDETYQIFLLSPGYPVPSNLHSVKTQINRPLSSLPASTVYWYIWTFSSRRTSQDFAFSKGRLIHICICFNILSSF